LGSLRGGRRGCRGEGEGGGGGGGGTSLIEEEVFWLGFGMIP
jgi:hypothetical protein